MNEPAALQGSCRHCGTVTDPVIEAHVIAADVAHEHRLAVEALYVRGGRDAYVTAARACAMTRIYKETQLGVQEIGKLFDCHHSTVVYHINGRARRNGGKEAART